MMKMKKLFTGVLVLAMCSMMAVPVLADTTITPGQDGNPNPGTGTTNISFTISPAYTVTIPGTVELEAVNTDGAITYEKDMTITASPGVRLKEGQYIQVTMAGDFTMETGDTTAAYTLPYTVTVGQNQIGDGGVVATFTSSTAQQASTLHFAAGNPAYAGDYTDRVTFNLSIVSE